MCRWLRSRDQDRERPFFLSYGMYATHRRFPDRRDPDIREDLALPPYPIPDTRETREDFAGYLTSVRSADTCFGQVIRCLKAEGFWDNTIVLFTTDHGLAFPFSKCTLFDSGIGVALMLHVPGNLAGGKVIDSLVSHVDVFPTLCDLLGFEKPDYLEGVSAVPLLSGERNFVRDDIFAEINFHTSYEPARCVRTGRYKYIRYYDASYLKINRSNIDESLTKDFFMDRDLDRQKKAGEALYDLVYDPGERRNLVGAPGYEDVLLDMRRRLEDYQEKTKDPVRSGLTEVKPGWKVNRKECLKASSKNPEDYV